ncbi:uncharacterized protein LOC141629030 [Silene latifolia]|uniref:uncharacterized protein LOC141629030 n=1 Tax=Silene latifolia TaxID=37657 RepID=UPI003D77CB64
MTGGPKSGDGKGATGENSGGGKDTIPMSSPLYLHPSDSPSLSLTQIKFDGENYDIWADAVKNGLDAKNKLEFIEGKIKQPVIKENGEGSLEAVAWRQCNAMIKAWLRNVIDQKLHPSITFSGTVSEIWEELRERFSAGNAPRVHQLKNELNECKQGNRSVVEYYTQLKTIWDELANYSRVPKCTCGAGAMLLKEREEEKVHQFLMGLNTNLYGIIRTNLLMEDEITTLNRAYSLILREERHKAVTRIKEEKTEVAMAVKNNSTSWGRGRGNISPEEEEVEPVRCTYCKKWYHEEENCYEKHGYPGRGRGRGRRGGRGRGRSGGRGQGTQFQSNAVASTSNANATASTKQRVIIVPSMKLYGEKPFEQFK